MKYKILILIPLAALVITGCQSKPDPQSALSLGMAAVEQHDYQGALEKFGSSIAEDKDIALAYRGEGIAYMGLLDYDKAIVSFDTALNNTNQENTDTIKDIKLYKASAQYKKADFSGTAETCSQILELGENGDAYYLRGASYLELGEETKAKPDFDRASTLAPEDYSMFFNIYECYKVKNLSAKGDEYLQKALSINGEEVNDYYQRGRIYYYLENYEKAKEQLLKPAEQKDKSSMLLLGKVYLELKDSSHARTVYQQYMDEYGESPEAYNGIALCDLADGSPDAAITTIQKGLALDTDAGKQDLYYNEIVAYERKQDFVTAKSKAAEYTSKYPDDLTGKKEADFLSTR